MDKGILKPGTWATYKLQKRTDKKPYITTLRLSIAGTELVADKPFMWFRMQVSGPSGPRFEVALLPEHLDFLHGGPLNIARYIFQQAGQNALEYVNIHTGNALLPVFDFARNFLPRAIRSAERGADLFSRGFYLGHPIERIEGGTNGDTHWMPQPQRLALDPELLIGTARSYKDAEGRRIYTPEQYVWGQSDQKELPDYTYVPFVEADYREMLDAGINLFWVQPDQQPFVEGKPVFFIRSNLKEVQFPEQCYRSNYLGTTMFMDEPGYLVLRDRLLADAGTPSEAADRFMTIVRERHEGAGGYGKRNMQQQLRNLGYDLGTMDIISAWYPIWEDVFGTIWYQLKAGMPGLVFEARYQPLAFAGRIKKVFDVDFPVDGKACIQFHDAFFHGAARHFDGDWGTAIYGQMLPELAPEVFQRAYNAGARYLWMWTCDHAHHVPYPEQLTLARGIRAYAAQHPRPRPIRPLYAQAQEAVVLPYGYHLDEFLMRWERLWNNEVFGLDKDNGYGVTHRAVLRAGVQQMIHLIHAGVDYDVAYNDECFNPSRYTAVHWVGEDATRVTMRQKV